MQSASFLYYYYYYYYYKIRKGGLLSVSRLFRKWGILDILQPYRLIPVTGITFFFLKYFEHA
jgi:hypothetical protein